MTRLHAIAAIIAIACAMAVTVYFLGGQAARDRAERDALQSTIDNARDYNEGKSDPAGTGFFDRLFPHGAD